MHKSTAWALSLCLASALEAFGCAGPQPQPSPEPAPEPTLAEEPADTLVLQDCPVHEDPDFGAVYIGIAIDDFNELGFSYGDSVNLSFSTGYTLENIPYFNGYYVKMGEPLLVSYPGYPSVVAGFNNGESLWKVAGLSEGDTVTVALNKAGEYGVVQETFQMAYEDERAKFETDVQFANFRALTGGDLVEGLFYRSASPVDDEHNRAGYVNALIEDAGVRFILDLSDNDGEIAAFQEDAAAKGTNISYFKSLLAEGNVCGIDLASNFTAQAFREKLAGGFIELTQHEGPYLLHCVEGKDRTGFACMLVEALAGATYDEILDDYMITYANYYGIDRATRPEQYDAVANLRLREMLCFLADLDEDADLTSVDFYEPARAYLQSGGMTDEQIDALVAIIRGKSA